jgi:hypothetical protein
MCSLGSDGVREQVSTPKLVPATMIEINWGVVVVKPKIVQHDSTF